VISNNIKDTTNETTTINKRKIIKIKSKIMLMKSDILISLADKEDFNIILFVNIYHKALDQQSLLYAVLN